MAPRSSWKGFIKLSLVSVPVKAYTASNTGAEIHLNQLHEECKNRIKYLKTCPAHGEVSNDEIVSGYEFAKGQYVVIDPEEVQKLRQQGDKSIEIFGFIPAGRLDPIFHSGRTYYLVPDGPVGQKPYALLMKGMDEEQYVAFGQIILSGKAQLILLRCYDDLMAMTILSHSEKIKASVAFKDEVTEPKITPEEMKLTKTLIDASVIRDFDFAAYKDDYVEKLTELIQFKVEGKEIVEVARPEEPQIINLMEALKASIANARGGEATPVADRQIDVLEPSKKSRKKASEVEESPTKMAPSATGRGARKKKSG